MHDTLDAKAGPQSDGMGDEAAKSKTSYKHWDGHHNVAFLVIATKDYIVFLDDKDQIDWETKDRYALPTGWEQVRSRYAALELTLSAQVHTGAKIAFVRMLAEGAARGLAGDIAGANEIIDQAEAFGDARNREVGRLVQLLSASVVMLLAAVLGIMSWCIRVRLESWLGPTPMALLLSGCAGAIGGWLWICTNRKDAPDPRGNIYLQCAEAVLRVTVGAFGAVLAVLALRSGMVFPPLAGAVTSISGMVLVSLVAGASEKMVPNLIRRLDGQDSSSSRRLGREPVEASGQVELAEGSDGSPPSGGVGRGRAGSEPPRSSK